MQSESALYETTESRWFKIVVIIVSGFFIGFSAANLFYYNKIRTNKGCTGSVTKGEATAMLWINGLLLAIAIIAFFWGLYRLVLGRDYRNAIVEYAKSPSTGFVTVAQGSQGFPTPAAIPIFAAPVGTQTTTQTQSASFSQQVPRPTVQSTNAPSVAPRPLPRGNVGATVAANM